MIREELAKLKKEKIYNFENRLKGFLEEYEMAQNSLINFNRHSDNCGNQARKVAEAFCRYIILNSDKPDGQKIHELEGALSTLQEKVTRSTNVYIEDTREREVLKARLKRILDIGNDASHDNSIVITKYDLEEIKNNLLYFSEYLSFKKDKEIVNKVSTERILLKSLKIKQEKIVLNDAIYELKEIILVPIRKRKKLIHISPWVEFFENLMFIILYILNLPFRWTNSSLMDINDEDDVDIFVTGLFIFMIFTILVLVVSIFTSPNGKVIYLIIFTLAIVTFFRISALYVKPYKKKIFFEINIKVYNIQYILQSENEQYVRALNDSIIESKLVGYSERSIEYNGSGEWIKK